MYLQPFPTRVMYPIIPNRARASRQNLLLALTNLKRRWNQVPIARAIHGRKCIYAAKVMSSHSTIFGSDQKLYPKYPYGSSVSYSPREPLVLFFSLSFLSFKTRKKNTNSGEVESALYGSWRGENLSKRYEWIEEDIGNGEKKRYWNVSLVTVV